MTADIFDGRVFAEQREQQLREKVQKLPTPLRMVSIIFPEDAASQLYTKLKFEAAARVGIEFDKVELSIADPVENIKQVIRQNSSREDVQGIMIQKPSKQVWYECQRQFLEGKSESYHLSADSFSDWWIELVASIDPAKDVDCLTRVNLQKVYEGSWQILPATVKAVLSILVFQARTGQHLETEFVKSTFKDKKVVIINRSDIVGRPLAAVLEQWGSQVELCGSRTLDLHTKTREADILVTATGKAHFITADYIKPGAIVIDVGAPGADIDFNTVKDIAGFLTPVPNGVGPITIVSLLENLFDLVCRPSML